MSQEASEQSAGQPNSAKAVAAVALCVGVGALLQVLAAQTDLWLDEVWTLELLPRIGQASDILFDLHHSNNHPLNTLFLYWMGDAGDQFLWYRLHTVLAGVWCIGVAAKIALRRGRAEAVFAAFLFATSFILVHHASQARGYSLMIAGALTAFYAVQRHHDSGSWASAAVYAACTAWAFLSNLYYLQTFVALSAWSGCVLLERGLRRGELGKAVLDIARLHALPVAVFGFVVYVFYLPGLTGSQFMTHKYGIIVQAASLLLGGPQTGELAQQLLVVVSLVLAGCIVALWRDANREWLLYAFAIFGAPALVLYVSQTQSLFVRFFVMSNVFGTLLIAVSLGRLFRLHKAGAVAACLLAVAMTYGNATHIGDLVERGRGEYFAALRYMAGEDEAPRLSVGSDHAFGTGMLVRFYEPLVLGKAFVFVDKEDRRRAPQWYIRVGHPRPKEMAHAGNLYDRDRLFPTSAFGFSWQLYRRVPMAEALRRRGIDGSGAPAAAR